MSDHTVATQPPPVGTGPSGRHPVNVGHLVMGVAFLGLTLVWALIVTDAVEGADIRWLLPIPWVAAGVAGVVASVLPSRRRAGQTRTGWVTDGSAEDQADATAEPTAPVTESTAQTESPSTEDTPEENR